MSIIINYTKKDYDAKIDALEACEIRLVERLTRMKELKSKMFEFWYDPGAQKAGQLLNAKIQSVENALDQTRDMLGFYRGAVNQLAGTGYVVDEILGGQLARLAGGFGGASNAGAGK